MAGRKLAEGVNVLIEDPATGQPRFFTGGSEVPDELAATVSNDEVWDESTREQLQAEQAEQAAREQAEQAKSDGAGADKTPRRKPSS